MQHQDEADRVEDRRMAAEAKVRKQAAKVAALAEDDPRKRPEQRILSIMRANAVIASTAYALSDDTR